MESSATPKPAGRAGGLSAPDRALGRQTDLAERDRPGPQTRSRSAPASAGALPEVVQADYLIRSYVQAWPPACRWSCGTTCATTPVPARGEQFRPDPPRFFAQDRPTTRSARWRTCWPAADSGASCASTRTCTSTGSSKAVKRCWCCGARRSGMARARCSLSRSAANRPVIGPDSGPFAKRRARSCGVQRDAGLALTERPVFVVYDEGHTASEQAAPVEQKAHPGQIKSKPDQSRSRRGRNVLSAAITYSRTRAGLRWRPAMAGRVRGGGVRLA